MNSPTALDLFCGAGGLSLGFAAAGFGILAGIDNNPHACQTFKTVHPEAEVLRADLTSLDPAKVAQRLGTNRVDVVLGGPPCQGMSLAGKRLTDDPRNRLFLEYVRFVDFFQPRFLLMENVAGLLSMQSGAINNAIVAELQNVGYSFDAWLGAVRLNAVAYGVPQFRDRLFYLGLRSPTDKVSIPRATHRAPTTPLIDDDGGMLPSVTVSQAIDDLPVVPSGGGADEMPYDAPPRTDYQRMMRLDSDTVYNHEPPAHTEKLLRMIEVAAPGSSVDPNYNDSKKWDPSAPSFTVKALGAGGGSTNRRAFHYRDNRGSTVRENARVQSFPDRIRFCGPKTDQMTQVGNAVPPLLAEAIARELHKSFVLGSFSKPQSSTRFETTR